MRTATLIILACIGHATWASTADLRNDEDSVRLTAQAQQRQPEAPQEPTRPYRARAQPKRPTLCQMDRSSMALFLDGVAYVAGNEESGEYGLALRMRRSLSGLDRRCYLYFRETQLGGSPINGF